MINMTYNALQMNRLNTKVMRNKVKITAISLLLFFGTSSLYAQYGGSAYVYAKSESGVTQVLHATWPNTKDNESQVKRELQSQLQNLATAIGGELTSGITYDISYQSDNDKKSYGGSAWVKVRNANGETRTINLQTACTENSPAKAKGGLLRQANNLKRSGEVFSTYIRYDIDSCQ